MPIAEKKYFTKKNIEKNKFDASGALAEQAVHCLELVAEMAQEGLKFQFKGGNSLLLILEKPRRFSIDVDIATDEPRERIEMCLDSLVKKQGVFLKWTKRQHKTKPFLPLASYYCHYKSHYVKADDAFIMLDAQLTRSPYDTHFVSVRCGGLYASTIKAEIPHASSMIGDKLLTLGPNTLGIPVGKGKEAQRLKHVYDVALLLGTNPPLHEIRKSFMACVEHENKLQEKSITIKNLITDTLDFCKCVKDHATTPEINENMSAILVENIKGIGPFAGHLFSNDYEWKHLKIDMAKVALVMSAVCNHGVKDETFHEVLRKLETFADTQFFWDKVESLFPVNEVTSKL
jgi:Nucleotidyl transferase AbiEii toxin, Type IV TA system